MQPFGQLARLTVHMREPAGLATPSGERTTATDAETADVALAASGDGGAFERLYRRHVARIFSLARRMAGPDVAEDVTQDVFVRAWQKLGTFRGQAAFGTWLYRVAVNVILERRRSLGVKESRFEAAEDLDEARARPFQPELALDFEDAIGRLPDGARQVFVLHDVAGYRHEEIAKLLGIVPGTSKSQLHHARMALRKHLEA